MALVFQVELHQGDEDPGGRLLLEIARSFGKHGYLVDFKLNEFAVDLQFRASNDGTHFDVVLCQLDQRPWWWVVVEGRSLTHELVHQALNIARNALGSQKSVSELQIITSKQLATWPVKH